MDVNVFSYHHGAAFNRWHERIIDCATGCGRKTTMTGTGLCDQCWEGQRRAQLAEQLRHSERDRFTS
ncbi:hypothetical protein E4T66_17355 [Sinimarinibacterium sp. CAU 1509]|uniref:hypothetical protein n=1 Tax=Sinimarinibacterium sp. CAU 1509 TaxID=2562283 RepID=UPI0010ABA81A|nr:hypothetical protein [Sinimarinibacterium sp. CAU 1509]TJY57178.1 hypothetical protein E4T66_17355 [Sinimarinibacterium sp. CAU 1509]